MFMLLTCFIASSTEPYFYWRQCHVIQLTADSRQQSTDFKTKTTERDDWRALPSQTLNPKIIVTVCLFAKPSATFIVTGLAAPFFVSLRVRESNNSAPFTLFQGFVLFKFSLGSLWRSFDIGHVNCNRIMKYGLEWIIMNVYDICLYQYANLPS